MFARLEILEAKTFSVCSQMIELTKASMSMTVERANEAGVVQRTSQRTKMALIKGGLELTSDVITPTKVFAKYLQKL